MFLLTWLLSISPLQKYSAGIMQRVDMMRRSLLKYRSGGRESGRKRGKGKEKNGAGEERRR
jgi:hypothetical protein